MKIRLISTIVLIVMLLAVQGVGYGGDGRRCSGVVVMFGNGVGNNKQKARLSTQLLMERLEAHISGVELSKHVHI